MAQGFRIYRADGSVKFDSDSIPLLFQDEFYLASGTTTRTIAGAAGRTARITQQGWSSMNSGASVSQANSGADLVVTISVSRSGYFRIMIDGPKLTNFGVQLETNAGQLAISSDQFVYTYVGAATFTGTQKPSAYSQLDGSGSGGFVAGQRDPFYIYQITCNTAPLPFIQNIGNGHYFATCSITQLTSTTWEIVIGGNDWTTVPVVKCFARMSGVGANGYGMKLFNAAGLRTFDALENFLTVGQQIDFPATENYTNNTGTFQTAAYAVANAYFMSISPAKISGVQSFKSGAFYKNN
jgi:hypothetical protein